MEYDLIDLFDHPANLFDFIASTIVTFGTVGSNQCVIQVEWKRSARESTIKTALTLKWDIDAIRAKNPLIDRQIQSLRSTTSIAGGEPNWRPLQLQQR
jgi:hypothetical protein